MPSGRYPECLTDMEFSRKKRLVHLMEEIRNESGTFTITDAGELWSFVPDKKNAVGKDSVWELHIPEGIRTLPENAFRGRKFGSVTLPGSLAVLGTGSGGAFSRCQVNRLTLPKKMLLGANAVSGSVIGEVSVPEDADPGMMRQLAHALRFSFSWNPGELSAKWPEEYQNIYLGKGEPRESWRSISNYSGIFWVDSDGVLMDYDLAQGNQTGREKEVCRLYIPEGVKAIPSGMFEDYTVLWEISFPKSLKYIGCVNKSTSYQGAFRGSRLPDVVLPENLELFGPYEFGACRIRSLTIPRSFLESYSHIYVRHFKSCSIGEIRVPVEFRDALEDCQKGYSFGEMIDSRLGHLFYMKTTHNELRDVDVYGVVSRLMEQT